MPPDNHTREIAARLKGLRDALDFTIEDFAARAHVSVDEVRSYEEGDTEVPVSYLFEVAKAFDVDLTALLTGDNAHLRGYSLVRAGKGLSVDRRKAYKYKSLAYRFFRPSMEPFIVTVPFAEDAELSFNSHPGEEFIYMLEGRLEITLENDVLVMEPHDSLYFSSKTAHALRALDGQDATFLDVII
ncbi:helix-turn-helix domain-containing protein [Oceanidesulfovibrio marinus]|uniref:helix-turn-helix domain-containing protein n=1 Tax=Oceanidesulfovibrio marinus TaxID=370038 RepID=UPI001F36F74B|nr:XRE family transcriptional regulator [Oceanidesulfovibrio marinus]